jgi:hypothetical protein
MQATTPAFQPVIRGSQSTQMLRISTIVTTKLCMVYDSESWIGVGGGLATVDGTDSMPIGVAFPGSVPPPELQVATISESDDGLDHVPVVVDMSSSLLTV